MAKKQKTLIFVGSAPLSKDFSAFIDSCDCVVRFNNCKNYGRNTGTKTDLLVLNNSGNPDTMRTLRFMLEPRTEAEVNRKLPYLHRAQEVLFARPPASFLADFVKTRIQQGPLKENELSELRPNRDLAAEITAAQQIPAKKTSPLPSEEFYCDVWDKLLAFGSTDAFAPSTGIMGIERVLNNPRFAEHRKFVTGFSWNMWEGHPAELERQLVLSYSERGIIKFLSPHRARLAQWKKRLSLKAWVKSTPVLYDRLLPIILRCRKPLRTIFRPDPKFELQRFKRLCRQLPQRTPDPFFVKIGANDGTTGDPCSRILLKNPRWKGLLIEPVPYCFEKLKTNFADPNRFILEPVAIGAEAGKALFYYVSEAARDHLPDLPGWHDKLGSFDRNHILKFLDGALEPFIVEHPLDVQTLTDVLARNDIQHIDLLHIDTEGHDFEILKTVNFEAFCPVLIFLEYNHLSEQDNAELCRFLRSNGYSVHNAGRDYLAIHKRKARRLRLYA